MFNRSFMIHDVICSVASQTYPNVELIVVDDGSSDIPAEFAAYIEAASIGANPIKFIRISHGGVSRARNVGVRQAGGDYIGFLDSDDLLFPGAISDLVTALESSSAQFSLGKVVETDYALSGPFLDADPLAATDILRRAAWMTHASLYRREAVLEIGGFDESLRVGEDSIFQLNVLATHGEGVKCPHFVGIRRRHQYGHLSMSPNLAHEHARTLVTLCSSICRNRFVASSSPVSRAMLLFAILYSIRKRSGRENELQLLYKYREACACMLQDFLIMRWIFTLLASSAGIIGRYGSLALLSTARTLRRGLSLATRHRHERELTEPSLLDEIAALATRLERARLRGAGR